MKIEIFNFHPISAWNLVKEKWRNEKEIDETSWTLGLQQLKKI